MPLEQLPPTVESNMWPQYDYTKKGTWTRWLTLLDMDNSIRHGFSQYRLPTPGKQVDVGSSLRHAETIELEWAKECATRNREGQYSGAPPVTALPLQAKVYLHQVIEEQKEEAPYHPAPEDLMWDY